MKKIKKIYGEDNWKWFFVHMFSFLVLVFFIWFIFLSDNLKNFLEALEIFVQTKKEYAYIIAFLAAIAEGTIILSIVPGTTYVLTMGVFLARGDLEWFFLFPIVIIGAFLGDWLGYFLGKLFSKNIKKKFDEDKTYFLAQQFIKKHGGKSIFLARFISGVKELVPFLAGCLSMNFKKFAFWNILGAVSWSILWIGVGFIFGNLVTKTEFIVKYVGLAFLIFFLISIYFYNKKNKKKIKSLLFE